uniref:BTB domain-containing protein n=1 Tax=Romanomermis culicivorax TaxID=13658 RepID=A0A915J3G6_ROMCU
MEHKIPFVVEWIPQLSRVVFAKPGRFIISPTFATKYKNTAYKWSIIFYPNGYSLSQSAIPALDDRIGNQILGDEDEETIGPTVRANNTSSKSAIFIVLRPFSTCSAKHVRVKAKVEFEISLKGNNAHIVGKVEDTLFRIQKIDMIKRGGSPKLLKGVSEFGPLCKEMVDQFTPISDERMAVTCRLYIDATDFDRWAGRQKPVSWLGGSYGRHRHHIGQKLRDCGIGVSGHESQEDSADSSEISCFDPVSIEDFDGIIGERPDLTLTSNDGYTYKCNYEKLSASSDVMARLFDPNSSYIESSTRSVTLPDITGKNLSFLLYFIYFGKLPIKAKDYITEILYMADKYMIKNLVEICINVMYDNVNSTNVFDYLKISVNHNLADLKEACLDVIYSNREGLFGENGQNLQAKAKLFARGENIGMILLNLLANRAAQSAGVISFH